MANQSHSHWEYMRRDEVEELVRRLEDEMARELSALRGADDLQERRLRQLEQDAMAWGEPIS